MVKRFDEARRLFDIASKSFGERREMAVLLARREIEQADIPANTENLYCSLNLLANVLQRDRFGLADEVAIKRHLNDVKMQLNEFTVFLVPDPRERVIKEVWT